MKVLLLGRHGQLARAVIRYFEKYLNGDLVVLGSSDFNLSDTGLITQKLSEIQPDWIINASAFTAVDLAETEKHQCEVLNHHAVAEIAKYSADSDVRLIHYSTDYVFDGRAQSPYDEEDETNPQTVYGTSKLNGEKAIVQSGAQAIIMRTSWVFDAHGKNFVNTMLRLASERDEINVVADQIGCPTFADDLAVASLQIIDKVEKGAPFVGGIFHVSGQGQTSWFDFCREIMRVSGHAIKVNPIKTEDYPTPAARPRYSVLDNTRLKQVYGLELAPWQEALTQCLAQKTVG